MQIVLLPCVELNPGEIKDDDMKISVKDYLDTCGPTTKEYEKKASLLREKHTAFNTEWQTAKTNIQQKINECKKVSPTPDTSANFT